jgi:hypothetical protein
MPITVKHSKVSTIPDDADTSLVRPSDWNADHTLTGLGTMAEQNANNVNITGGSITGVSGLGTVTSVGGTGTVNGISLSGTVTTSGNLTLGGTLSGVSLATQVTGTLPVANGGTGATTLTGLVLGNGTSVMTTVTAPSGAVVGTTDTQTLTNKRVNPRAVAAGATSGTLTPNGDTTDVFNAFGLTGAITVATPSGTPVDGQRLMLRFEDNGTGRGITWTGTSGAYRAIGVTLPTTTVASKVTYVGCVYNSTDVFWDAIAVATQA